MKNKIIIPALIAIMLAAQGSAFADDHDHDRGHRDDHRGPPHKMQHDNRHHDHGGRGAGPRHEFHRGDRLSGEYRHRQYVVDNWRVHHLNPPPRGYQWVQTGPDYVLVSVGNGIIAQIVLGR
jgi:Ni/Co efflux regulator RcnB